jgi:ubiquinone biosynthesis protein
MEHIHGNKVTQVEDLSEGARERLAATIIEALVAQPVWSEHERGLFHADPHAGNLLLTDDRNLGLLDWSLVGCLAAEQRLQVMQLMLGAVSFDVQSIIRAIVQLGRSRPDEAALRGVVEKSLDQVYRGRFPGFRWLLDLLDQAMFLAKMRFDKDLLLFRKSVLTLEGVIADISSQESFDRILTAAALRQLSQEWGERIFALPTSRDFGSRVSNLDLMALYFELPATMSRLWQHHLQQWLLGPRR